MKKQIFKLQAIAILIVSILLSNAAAQQDTSKSPQQNEVERLLTGIVQSLKSRDYDGMIEQSNRLLVLLPKSGDIYVFRGTGFVMKGEMEKGVADLTKGLELGVSPRAEVSTYKLRGVSLYQLKRYDEAIRDFNFLIQKDAGDFRAYVYRGSALAYKGNHQAALADFDSVIKLNPREKSVYRLRAVSHYQLGNYEKAIEDASEEIKINPEAHPETYKTRADAYRKLGKTELADADAKKFEELRAKTPSPARQQQQESAQVRLEKLIEKAQDHFGKREWDAAIAVYDEIINLLGDNSEGLYAVYFSRGRCFYEKGNLDRALADYNEVIKRRPDLSGGFTFRGEVYLQRNQLDLAVTDFTRAIKLNSSDILAYRRRAEAYNLKKDFDNAVKDCNEIIRLDPSYQSGWYWRADSYFQKGDYKAALNDITEFIRLDNLNGAGYSLRAKVYRKLNDDKAADADEKRAILLANNSQSHE